MVNDPAAGGDGYDEEARAHLERATFGGRLELGTRPAILVVDFSLAFTDPSSTLGADFSAELAATRRLLDAGRAKGALVVFTALGFEPHLQDGGLMVRKLPAAAGVLVGTRWVEIDPRLGRREDEPVVIKKSASAFFGTNVAALLSAHRVDSAILCGSIVSGCIRATAVDLFHHNIPSLVPRECVADRATAPKDANLVEMHARYVDVVSLEEAIAYLDGVPGA